MKNIRKVAILGSTGSIGSQGLDVIAELPELEVCALAAGNNWKLLSEQIRLHRPGIAAISSDPPGEMNLPDGVNLLVGESAMVEMVSACDADVVLSGVMGTAGLQAALAAIESRADLAIANKETIVAAGEIIIPAAREAGIHLLPVDSEHSAIFQCLAGSDASQVRKVTITSSGGSLRDFDDEEAENASITDVLNHPTWSMGQKITVDSATLINKSLEVIEANMLFGLSPEQIDVVIHPESIVHAMVEFCDGSVIAMLGEPDMKTPIAYALAYPNRPVRQTACLDLASTGKLTFARPAGRELNAINLAYRVIEMGKLAGAVFNAANEAAVQGFLKKKISFGMIVPIVERILNQTPSTSEVNIEAIIDADRWARQQVQDEIDKIL